MSSLGARIRKLRREGDLRQKDLAARANISVPFVSDIENDKRNVSSQVLFRLSKALDTSMQWLMTGQKLEGGQEVEAPTTIPSELNTVALNEGWPYADVVDVLSFVRRASARSENYKEPERVSGLEWTCIRNHLLSA